jgi:hypothetical protein
VYITEKGLFLSLSLSGGFVLSLSLLPCCFCIYHEISILSLSPRRRRRRRKRRG